MFHSQVTKKEKSKKNCPRKGKNKTKSIEMLEMG